MSIATTIFHISGQTTTAIEQALEAIFAREERPRALRVEGSYSAVVERVTDPELDAAYRYLILRARASGWTPILELGARTDGLDIALSQQLGGAPVIAVFQYGGVVSGYRIVRDGAEVDRYISDPTAFAEMSGDTENASPDLGLEMLRGRPERFADLLPAGTAPEDFWRIVLRPGWWEAHDVAQRAGSISDEGSRSPSVGRGGAGGAGGAGDDDDVDSDIVDEVDRMRCIAIAFELWSPDDYPLTQDVEDIPNAVVGPAIALAWE